MESAKQAVQSFISRDGKHKTTAEETVGKAVVDEHIRPHQHEEVNVAVDKEIHQDHHHTTIQPIQAQQTLPEEHRHNVMPVEHKTFDNRNPNELRETLEQEKAKFRDTSVTHETTRSTSEAPVAMAERIHHHVHEHVQPVIQKEVVAPKVIHTTVPIHETHHAHAVHHGTSTLPVKTLEEFQANKGILQGRENHKIGEYEGCPKPYNKEFQNERLEGDKDMHLHHHDHQHGGSGMAAATAGTALGAAAGRHRHRTNRSGSNSSSSSSSDSDSGTRGHHSKTGRKAGLGGTGMGAAGPGTGTSTAPHQSSMLNKLDPRVDTSRDNRDAGSDLTGRGIGGSNPTTKNTMNTVEPTVNYGLSDRGTQPGARTGGLNTASGVPRGSAGVTQGSGVTGTSGTTTGQEQKPTLLDRLNPLKDSDHDGQKGFMK